MILGTGWGPNFKNSPEPPGLASPEEVVRCIGHLPGFETHLGCGGEEGHSENQRPIYFVES